MKGFPLVIPCHRLLAAGGKIGGFPAFGGSYSKVWMLEIEGVTVEAHELKPATAKKPAGQLDFEF